MVIYIKKILLFLCLFFLFNTLEVDSNNDKILFYNKNELYEEDYHIIYFYNVTSKKLESILDILDIEVLCYIVDNNKYYVRNVNELISKYFEDKMINEQLYYNEYGINIDAICVICTNNELLKLENLTGVY